MMENLSTDIYPLYKRVGAFIIDSIILMIVCGILCVSLYEQLLKLGNIAVIVGFIIYVVYYGIQNSYICKGQTIGKRLFKIKVIDKNGKYLSVMKSFIRAIVLTPIFIFNKLASVSYLYIATSYVISFYSILEASLFLFNTPTRRTVHDYLSGSIVVSADTNEINEQKNKKAFAITAIVAILTLCGVLVINILQNKIGLDWREVNKLSKIIKTDFNRNLVMYNINKHYSSQSGQSVTTVSIGVSANDINLKDYNECLYNTLKIVNCINKNDIDIKYDILNILLVKNVNIGMFSTMHNYRLGGNKEQWINSIKSYKID